MSGRSLTSRALEFKTPADAIEHYHNKGWTDGLPIVPPTVEAVESFLEYVGRSPSEIVATEPVKGRVITAEKVAINSVMAGCRAEYLPVVLAAVEAMCEEQYNLHATTASTDGAAVLTVVNGPIVRRIGMNSGISVFGPGNRANATIGRAIRLVITNASGAVPGEMDKSTLGHPGKYTFCIAEAEDVNPWEPLHVDRGLSSDQSAVSVFAALSPIRVANQEDHRPEAILTSFVDGLFAIGPSQSEVVVVLSPELVGHLRSAGWTKRQVKEYLCEQACRPIGRWVAAGRIPDPGAAEETERALGALQDPDSVTIVVAGGLAGAFAAVIPLWSGGSRARSVTRRIDSPS